MKNVCLILLSFFCLNAFSKPTLTVSSKTFTESFLLGEILAQIIESTGEAEVDRKLGLGDTAIVFEGVKNKKVDFYVEYTGTLADSLIKDPSLTSVEQIRNALEKMGLTIGEPLGFNNTYAISMLEKQADAMGIRSIADLKKHQDSLRVGFTNSFIEREDGYPLLKVAYGLNFKNLKGLAHGLKVEALINEKIDVVDLYATDAKIPKFNIRVLSDEKGAFPRYYAVILTRPDVIEKFPRTWRAMQKIEGTITDSKMAALNAEVEIEKKSLGEAAANFLSLDYNSSTKFEQLIQLTKEHLFLVILSMLAAIAVGIPLAIIARYYNKLGQAILLITGLIQTIPSLALLCFLIPLFGIGVFPALIALFLYSLLPIVRSTYVGLVDINPKLLEVGKALGLSKRQQLRLIELPIAARNILSGIKTSAIINVGTATLAALIGAGGYGDPIVTGLGLNDIGVILEGAIPAAVLALFVHGFFEIMDRVVIPKGLR